MSVVAPNGARAANRAETRRLVQDAALRLAEEKGFENTSVADIAAASFISIRTFFRHFESKQDAIWSWFDDEMASLADHLADAPPALDDRGAVRHAVEAYALSMHGREQVVARYIGLVAESPGLARFGLEQAASVVASEALARRSASFAPTLQQRVLGRAAAASIAAAMEAYLDAGGHAPLVDLLMTARDVAVPAAC